MQAAEPSRGTGGCGLRSWIWAGGMAALVLAGAVVFHYRTNPTAVLPQSASDAVTADELSSAQSASGEQAPVVMPRSEVPTRRRSAEAATTVATTNRPASQADELLGRLVRTDL